jgi:hypothetical protein
MIRTPVLGAHLLAFAAAATLDAQSTPKPTGPDPATKPLTIVGCIQVDGGTRESFTISDKKTGTTYQLKGPEVQAFVWRNVRIVGGLVPTPNIAAQAGNIDETRAAMAHEGANRPSIGDLPSVELRVKQVKTLSGSCAPKANQAPTANPPRKPQ